MYFIWFLTFYNLMETIVSTFISISENSQTGRSICTFKEHVRYGCS